MPNPRRPEDGRITCPLCSGTGRITRGQSGADVTHSYRRALSKTTRARVHARVKREMRQKQGQRRQSNINRARFKQRAERAKRRRLR